MSAQFILTFVDGCMHTIVHLPYVYMLRNVVHRHGQLAQHCALATGRLYWAGSRETTGLLDQGGIFSTTQVELTRHAD